MEQPLRSLEELATELGFDISEVKDLPLSGPEGFREWSKGQNSLANGVLQHAFIFRQWKQLREVKIAPKVDKLEALCEESDAMIQEILHLTFDEFRTLSLEILGNRFLDHAALFQLFLKQVEELKIPAKAAQSALVSKRKIIITPCGSKVQDQPPNKKQKVPSAGHKVKNASIDLPKKGSPVDRICRGLAELRALGMEEPSRSRVAIAASYPGGNNEGFIKAYGQAKKAGLVEYPAKKQTLRLSAAGLQITPVMEPPKSNSEMLVRLQQVLKKTKGVPKKAAKIVELLSDGQEHTCESAAAFAEYDHNKTEGFKKLISTLNSLEIIERPVKGLDGTLRLGDAAFPYGRNLQATFSDAFEATTPVKHEDKTYVFN